MSSSRSALRPRYGRLSALLTSLTVTAVAALAGTGVINSGPSSSAGAAVSSVSAEVGDPVEAAAGDVGGDPNEAAGGSSNDPAPARSADAQQPEPEMTPGVTTEADIALPARSGTGRRVVFSEERQRVWLVEEDGPVRTYPVSGSLYDNLDPGTFEVYSRSEQAWGIDDSGTMKYFVRFTQGDNAAIGFHDIPIKDDELVQTVGQLGTPLSHGCIRQKRSDAKALWAFAPIGTTVVVTA